jgi:exopolyphosphatase/guanosine-5'-triphosphate,3'-diphosphate pyrophosphatase
MHTPSAIIDLGTNTFNLLVFTRDEQGLRVVHSVELPVFLGRGGVERGVIADDAFARGIAALEQHRAMALAHGATSIRGFGTSALRNASNGTRFVEEVRSKLGIPITIIPGEEEAGLILDGVRQAVRFTGRPALVMDIGGGSIEFILATDKALMWKQSYEVGTTRLRERMPLSEPCTLDEESRVAEHLDARLEALCAVIDRHEPHVLIGSAGSFDTLAAMVVAARGATLGPEATSLEFAAAEFDALKDRLMRMTRAERLRMPGLPEHRVDTILYALIATERVLQAGGIRDMIWSRYSLKEGAAARMG